MLPFFKASEEEMGCALLGKEESFVIASRFYSVCQMDSSVLKAGPKGLTKLYDS